MPNQSSSQHSQLSYEPLPDAALRAVSDSFSQLGFEMEAIEKDYSFSSAKSLVRVNALAFAHPLQRNLNDYASVTVFNAVNGHNDEYIVSRLAESSAPYHLINRENSFAFWTSSINIDTNNRNKLQVKAIQEVQSISYDRLGEVLNNYADDLKPQRIIDVKQGREVFKQFSYINPSQLCFWAEAIRSKPLVQHFEQAIQVLRKHPDQLPKDIITNIATQLLGLLILTDTGSFGQNIRLNRPSLPKLIDEAYDKFPHYFDKWLLSNKYPDAVARAYSVLQTIQYAGFVPDMLGDLYAAAYEREERKQLGNYDTPLYLTRRILETIPIEQLPPHERVIADVTCGWGSFLIAGYERIANLSDSKGVPFQQYLHGNDVDPFFVQLSQLGLMRATARDDWNIGNKDAFQWEWLKNHQPNIIVGNPPFLGNRKEPFRAAQQAEDDQAKETNEQKRDEKANKFLEQAIERLKPGGYLALVMPRSFTISEAGPDTRKKLLEECDIFELWELPSQVFQGVTVRTTVVFAQKKRVADSEVKQSASVRIRTLQPRTIVTFKNTGIFTNSTLVADQSIWHSAVRKSRSKTITHVIEYTTVLPKFTWEAIQKPCIELQKCADLTRGVTRGTKRRNHGVLAKNVDWLPNVDDTFPYSYVLDYTKAKKLLYPDDCERPRLKYEALFQAQKVLLQYVQTPSWGNRVKVAIERRGYYVSEHFYAIGIQEKTHWNSYTLTNEILTAILGWDVSNAWIIEHMRSAGVPSHAVNTIPIPKYLSKDDCNKLTNAVLVLEKEATAGNIVSESAKEAHNVIDRILQAAYHLDENTFKRLREVRYWEREQHITLDIQPEQARARWLTSGIVDYVDAKKGEITLWIDGFNELQPVNIVPSMPGWLLRPNAAFLTRIPREYRRQKKIAPDTYDWGIFHPQPYMYMTDDDLMGELSKHFVARPQ